MDVIIYIPLAKCAPRASDGTFAGYNLSPLRKQIVYCKSTQWNEMQKIIPAVPFQVLN